MAGSDLRRRGAANLLCRTDVGGEDGAVEARGYRLQVTGCGLRVAGWKLTDRFVSVQCSKPREFRLASTDRKTIAVQFAVFVSPQKNL